MTSNALDTLPAAESELKIPFQEELLTLLRNRSAIISMSIVGLVVLAAIFAPVLAPYDPAVQDYEHRLDPPSADHWLGTDRAGRDTLSRLIHGARVSLIVGLSSVLLSMLLGVPLGILSGYYGGRLDDILMRVIDALMAFPALIMALMILAALGDGLTNVVIAIAVAFVPRFARLARAPTLAVKERQFVEAAQAQGMSDARILLVHVFPNVMAPIIILATLYLANAIRQEANLSFLGLGVQPPTATWGNMIRDGMLVLRDAPSQALVSGVAIIVIVLAFNILGDGIRDAFDPNLRGEGAVAKE
jgi:peptide/nickel transport system permease protein